MKSTTRQTTRSLEVLRVKHWSQHWNSCKVGTVASLQLVACLAIVGMEIGNSIVDIYRANVYSGFWSFPFTMSAVIGTYATVCMKKTQTKAIVALVLQSIAVVVLLVVVGFLIAFIATNFTFCLSFQCSQTSTTFVSKSNTSAYQYSAATYALLKRMFVICELVFAVIFIMFATVYIILFIQCAKEIPNISPGRVQTTKSQSTTVYHSSTVSMTNISHLQSANSDRTATAVSSSTTSYYRAQKVCPNCGHVSPYIPISNIVECPKCNYRSPLVEHAQQWSS